VPQRKEETAPVAAVPMPVQSAAALSGKGPNVDLDAPSLSTPSTKSIIGGRKNAPKRTGVSLKSSLLGYSYKVPSRIEFMTLVN